MSISVIDYFNIAHVSINTTNDLKVEANESEKKNCIACRFWQYGFGARINSNPTSQTQNGECQRRVERYESKNYEVLNVS